jgi:DNA-binding CsgD family transcriptional regulator
MTERELHGRGRERDRLADVLDGARRGAGEALVLWGGPGIGKSALLAAGTADSADFTVLAGGGSRSEAGFTFAGLHQLLTPVAGRIAGLPGPQGAALLAAFGQEHGPADPFLVGTAVCTLVSELAGQRPVLVAVDDVHWLDEASARCLAFVARRLRNTRIAMVLVTRDDPDIGVWHGLPTLRLRGLDDTAAYSLAASSGLDRTSIRQVVRLAGGNPLALRQLPLTLRTVERPLPGDRLPVGSRLCAAFASTLDGLAAETRDLLLLIAAADGITRQALRGAGAALGVAAATWEEVSRSDLLDTRGGHVLFRQPLLAAVVYELAPLSARRTAHRVLADVVAAQGFEDLRRWHLAAAAEYADEELAQLLEDSADQSWTRGACVTAARMLRRAVELTPVPVDAARRAARAARAAWEAGEVDVARDLLRCAERLCGSTAAAELADGLRGLIEFAHRDQELAHRYLTRDLPNASDPGTALELGVTAVRAGWSAGRPELQAEALRQLTARADPELVPLLNSWWGDGGSAAAADGVERLAALSWRLVPPAPLSVAWGREQGLSVALRRRIVELRGTEAVTDLAAFLAQTVTLDIAQGNWNRAAAAAAEGLALAERIGAEHVSSQCRNCLGWLAAARGDEQFVTAAAARTMELAVPCGVRALAAAATWNVGMSALFAGRGEEALQHLLRLAEPEQDVAHPTFALLAAVDTIEAAAHAGQPEAAGPITRTVRDWAARTNASWALAAVHLADALSGSGPASEDAFRRALSVPGAASRPFAHARTQLLYGEWLRRARRRTEARAHLAEAAVTFRQLNAAPLLERAESEQDLTGRRSREGDCLPTGLTAQELRVARMAGTGLTNREIAAQLLISPRTVGHHLANVFPKLGITSRAELNGIRLA